MSYGNTVGSQQKKVVTWSTEIRLLQKRLTLNPLQSDVLFGTLLGDGCLVANAYGKNYRLKIQHGDKQKTYTNWKYEIFRDWCLSKPKFQEVTNSWIFRTISHPEFTKVHKLFYREKKKILPQNIKKVLKNPFVIAVWYMDDGALGPNKHGFTFNTQNFTKEESEYLIECLNRNFQLRASLHKDKNSWRIYILSESVSNFRRLIEPFILPELQYKLLSV